MTNEAPEQRGLRRQTSRSTAWGLRSLRFVDRHLIGGQLEEAHWWDGVRGDFHAERRTITIDYRGTGESDSPDRPYITEGFADDAMAVLDDLGIERADVYGTSMGTRRPVVRRPSSHSCAGPGAGLHIPGGQHGIERSDAVRRALTAPTPADSERALLSLMYSSSWLENHPGPHHTLGDPAMLPHARRRHLPPSAHHDVWDALPAVSAPTLVIHGTDDQLYPTANAPLLAARIPGARLHLTEGARHAYFEEFRATASELVLDFLG